MYCEHCGNKLNENAIICMKCGCKAPKRKVQKSQNKIVLTEEEKVLLGFKIARTVYGIIGAFVAVFILVFVMPFTLLFVGYDGLTFGSWLGIFLVTLISAAMFVIISLPTFMSKNYKLDIVSCIFTMIQLLCVFISLSIGMILSTVPLETIIISIVLLCIILTLVINIFIINKTKKLLQQ
jgi:hypothetical protein